MSFSESNDLASVLFRRCVARVGEHAAVGHRSEAFVAGENVPMDLREDGCLWNRGALVVASNALLAKVQVINKVHAGFSYVVL